MSGLSQQAPTTRRRRYAPAVTWLDALGWAGSALLIYSLMQARVLRFRLLNLTASFVLLVFNGLLGIWPMVGMNVALCLINLWFIRRLVGQRHDPSAYQVLPVRADDAYLQHVLRSRADDIHRFFPDFHLDRDLAERSAFLVQRDDETVGVFVAHNAGGGVAQVDLDYVTPRFRDFTPGEFVYRHSGLFRDRGYHTVLTPPGMVEPYYESLGFQRQGASYRLDL